MARMMIKSHGEILMPWKMKRVLAREHSIASVWRLEALRRRVVAALQWRARST